jgi:hypothetical protein
MNERQTQTEKPAKSKNGSEVRLTRETPASSETKPINELTPEEQMALYEKELKENDWGHQPC